MELQIKLFFLVLKRPSETTKKTGFYARFVALKKLVSEIRERGQDPKWATDTEKEVLGPEANLERTCHFAFSSLSPIGY